MYDLYKESNTMSPKGFSICFEIYNEVQELQQKIRKIDLNISEKKKILTEKEDRLPLAQDAISIESSWDEDLEDLSYWTQVENDLRHEIKSLKNMISELLEKKRELRRDLFKIENEIKNL